jgi:hypothetical protein
MAIVERVVGLSITKEFLGGGTNEIRAEVRTVVYDDADDEQLRGRSFNVPLTAGEISNLRTFIGNLIARASHKRVPTNL